MPFSNSMHKQPGIRPFATPHDALVFALNTALSAHRLYKISLEEALAKAMLWVNVSQRLGEDWLVDENMRSLYYRRIDKLVKERKCIKCGRNLEEGYNRKTCPECLEQNKVRLRKRMQNIWIKEKGSGPVVQET